MIETKVTDFNDKIKSLLIYVNKIYLKSLTPFARKQSIIKIELQEKMSNCFLDRNKLEYKR